MYGDYTHGESLSVIGALQSISSSRAGGGATTTWRATVVAVAMSVASDSG